MISLIICSINDELFQRFANNVAETIGVEYELIRIDNSRNEYSIFTAYNLGTLKAKYEYICFVHEDVEFNTSDWGKVVVNTFADNPRLGLLGVAGSKYKSFAPAGWGLIPESRYINIVQEHKYEDYPISHDYQNDSNARLVAVVCIDGVWMCTTKTIATQIRFDEDTYTGFHCYDIDFSLNVLSRYEVAVTFDILMTHFSEGKNDKGWVEASLRFHKKWCKKLPVIVGDLSQYDVPFSEGNALHHFVKQMMYYKYPAIKIWNLLAMNNRNKFLNKNFLLSLKLRVIKYWLGIIKVTVR